MAEREGEIETQEIMKKSKNLQHKFSKINKLHN